MFLAGQNTVHRTFCTSECFLHLRVLFAPMLSLLKWMPGRIYLSLHSSSFPRITQGLLGSCEVTPSFRYTSPLSRLSIETLESCLQNAQSPCRRHRRHHLRRRQYNAHHGHYLADSQHSQGEMLYGSAHGDLIHGC